MLKLRLPISLPREEIQEMTPVGMAINCVGGRREYRFGASRKMTHTMVSFVLKPNSLTMILKNECSMDQFFGIERMRQMNAHLLNVNTPLLGMLRTKLMQKINQDLGSKKAS